MTKCSDISVSDFCVLLFQGFLTGRGAALVLDIGLIIGPVLTFSRYLKLIFDLLRHVHCMLEEHW